MQKIKVFIGLFYLIILSSFLLFFFSNFSFQEVTSYNFIKNNRDYFFELKNSNLIFLSITYIIITMLWIFAAGFGSQVTYILYQK